MTFINFLGGLINGFIGHISGDLSDLPGSMVFVAIFCGLYLWLTLIKIGIKNEYRLPLMRTVLWTVIISADLIFRRDNRIETADYVLFLNNNGLNLFYNTFFLKVYHGKQGIDCFAIYGIGIFIFALYEFSIIKISTLLADRIIVKKRPDHQATSNEPDKNAS
jgi:hypothetical protein